MRKIHSIWAALVLAAFALTMVSCDDFCNWDGYDEYDGDYDSDMSRVICGTWEGDFDGVERLRTLAYQDLDKALLLGVETTVQEMVDRKLPIHTKTLLAQQWLREHGVTTED